MSRMEAGWSSEHAAFYRKRLQQVRCELSETEASRSYTAHPTTLAAATPLEGARRMLLEALRDSTGGEGNDAEPSGGHLRSTVLTVVSETRLRPRVVCHMRRNRLRLAIITRARHGPRVSQQSACVLAIGERRRAVPAPSAQRPPRGELLLRSALVTPRRKRRKIELCQIGRDRWKCFPQSRA